MGIVKMIKCDTSGPQCFIYGLIDPRTDEIRYVGKTTRGLHRVLAHGKSIGVTKEKHTHKYRWIRSLKELGLSYKWSILEIVENVVSIDDRERFWISHGRDSGWNLTNATDGGDGARHSPEVLARMAAKKRGKKQSPETIAKRIASLTGLHYGPPSTQKRITLSASNLGKKDSPETRSRKRAAQKLRAARDRDLGFRRRTWKIGRLSDEAKRDVISRLTNRTATYAQLAMEYKVSVHCIRRTHSTAGSLPCSDSSASFVA
jgi:hypothetical protein